MCLFLHHNCSQRRGSPPCRSACFIRCKAVAGPSNGRSSNTGVKDSLTTSLHLLNLSPCSSKSTHKVLTSPSPSASSGLSSLTLSLLLPAPVSLPALNRARRFSAKSGASEAGIISAFTQSPLRNINACRSPHWTSASALRLTSWPKVNPPKGSDATHTQSPWAGFTNWACFGVPVCPPVRPTVPVCSWNSSPNKLSIATRAPFSS